MKSAKRVILNTAFLYGKMLITIFISLYSTRLILDALGIYDFGIYNVVGGIIGMLTFLNGAMSISTQRYISFYLGANEKEKLKDIFKTSVLLHLIIAGAIVVILEIAGFFIFDGALNIPEQRIRSAKFIFQAMIVSTFFTINAVPYDATINAHENMLFDALVGIFESFVKLGIAILLVHAIIDKLIMYGILLASLTILVRIIKSFYCIKKYEECSLHYKSSGNKTLFIEMFSFAGWNTFGAFCNVVKYQGIAIVINIFVGVAANAAYGIANQVNSQLSAFSANIIKALNPQIVKSEGAGERTRMLKLASISSKLSFFLLAFFAVPLIVEMHYVLSIWLKFVPENAAIFCQLILIVSLIQQITWGLMVAVQSVGRIKIYQIVVGSLLVLNLPLSILLMKIGLPSFTIFIGAIVLEIIAGVARVYFAHLITGLERKQYLIKTVLSSFFSIALAISIAYMTHLFMEENFLRLVLSTSASSLAILLLGRFIAISKEEYEKIKELLNGAIKCIIRRIMPGLQKNI